MALRHIAAVFAAGAILTGHNFTLPTGKYSFEGAFTKTQGLRT